MRKLIILSRLAFYLSIFLFGISGWMASLTGHKTWIVLLIISISVIALCIWFFTTVRALLHHENSLEC